MRTAFQSTRSNPLAGIPCVSGKVAVYIPTTIHSKPAPDLIVRYQREKVAEALARWFGGYTETQGTGGWYSENLGEIIREKVWIVTAGAEQAVIDRVLPALLVIVRQIGLAMEQEAVTLEVNGTLYFVPTAAAVAV